MPERIACSLKRFAKRVPFAAGLVRWARRRAGGQPRPFLGSRTYWEQRYRDGGNSGAGSFNRLALFKAEIVNDFVLKRHISSVIEFGCGDGNQLRLARYPRYIGFDVSQKAIDLCKALFKSDDRKEFDLIDNYAGQKADLALSLDVIYHLIEDDVFHAYMERLFSASIRFVVVYSSDDEKLNEGMAWEHVRHRNFTRWVSDRAPGWRLMQQMRNRYPYIETDPDQTSLADFYFFERRP